MSQLHSMCIPHGRNTTPTNILCLVMGDLSLSITITHTTADSQGGQEKTALQETWVGPRQTAASPQGFYITRSRLEGW